MTDALPEPLIPAEVDLRDLPYMPLDVRRLRDSRLVATCRPEAVVAAILLWSASWHQQPAASLPDDDAELAQLAGLGRDVKEFRRIRVGALHGLILCNDGRWYHPVVAEKAAEAWNARLENEWRRACDRTRKENKERKERHEAEVGMPAKPQLLSMRHVDGIPSWDYNDSAGIPAERLRNSSLKGKGKQGRTRERDVSSSSGAIAPSAPKLELVGPEPPKSPSSASNRDTPTSAVWQAYAEAHERRYGVAPVRNARVNGQLADFVTRIPAAEAPEVAAWYVASDRGLYVSAGHPVNLLLRDAEQLRTDWATRTQRTDTQARRADRTAATGNAVKELIEETRRCD